MSSRQSFNPDVTMVDDGTFDYEAATAKNLNLVKDLEAEIEAQWQKLREGEKLKEAIRDRIAQKTKDASDRHAKEVDSIREEISTLEKEIDEVNTRTVSPLDRLRNDAEIVQAAKACLSSVERFDEAQKEKMLLMIDLQDLINERCSNAGMTSPGFDRRQQEERSESAEDLQLESNVDVEDDQMELGSDETFEPGDETINRSAKAG